MDRTAHFLSATLGFQKTVLQNSLIKGVGEITLNLEMFCPDKLTFYNRIEIKKICSIHGLRNYPVR